MRVQYLYTPKPPEFIKLQSEIVNKSLNNVSITQEEMKSLISASVGSGWVRLHPESLDIPENITFQQMKPGRSRYRSYGIAMPTPQYFIHGYIWCDSYEGDELIQCISNLDTPLIKH